jgi:hypothetical protein
MAELEPVPAEPQPPLELGDRVCVQLRVACTEVDHWPGEDGATGTVLLRSCMRAARGSSHIYYVSHDRVVDPLGLAVSGLYARDELVRLQPTAKCAGTSFDASSGLGVDEDALRAS